MRICRGFILFAAVGLAAGPRVVADEPLPGPRAQMVVSKKQIDLKSLGGVVASYVIDPSAAKPYFWPMNALPAISVTRAWPINDSEKLTAKEKDHVHHRSAWFCHGDVIPEGLELKHKIKNVDGVDFWSEARGHGRIVSVKRDWVKGGTPTHRSMVSQNEWQTADGEKILDETRTMHLLLVNGRPLIVVDIDLHASVCPITFGDTKEGSFGVRVRDLMNEERGGGKLTNADGKTGMKDVWGQKSNWCDYSGAVPVSNTGETKTGGVAIFDHPANKHRACWHARNYGLMAANPFGRNRSGFPAVKGQTDLAKLAKGEHLKLRYGLYTHWGDVKEGKVAETYDAFVKLK
jgi:hypothetical protein